MRKYNNIAVLYGGNSEERNVSLRSGQNVYNALLRKNFNAVLIDTAKEKIPDGIDAAYICLHGKGGEDGSIQGYLTSLNIPYTGPGILASASSMNKITAKQLVKAHGIQTPDFEIINTPETTLEYPFVLKPADAGSSIGVHLIKNKQDFIGKFKDVSKKFSNILVEKYIKGTEITVGIIEENNKFTILPILQLVPHNEFYDYEAKYTKGLTDFILPAKISKNAEEKAKKMALDIFKCLKCKNVSRIDMIVDRNDDVFFIENNTSPGMTDTSDLPAQAKSAGIEYDDLVERIILSAGL